MASNNGSLKPLRRWSMPMPLTFSELRIVLLGTNIHYTNKLANILLGREAFQTEAPSYLIDHHCERVSGRVEGRTITIINAPHLNNPKLSQKELIQKVKECITLSDPGPHVFLLVLQSQNLTKEYNDRIISTLYSYIPQSINRLLLVTTAEEHGFFSTCISECEMKHYRIVNLSPFNKHQVLQLLKKIDVMVTENGGDHMTCTVNEPQERKNLGLPRPQDQHYSLETTSTDPAVKRKQLVQSRVCELRIVLLGKHLSDTSTVGNFILGRDAFQTEVPPHSVDLHSERARGDVEGRYITIINSPHLFKQNFSHHQLNLHIKECKHLADPGPHVIILVVQPDDFTEADRNRMNSIFSAVSDEVYRHSMVLSMETMELGTSVDPPEETAVHEITADCNKRHLVFNRCSRDDLLQMIDVMMVNMNNESLNWEEFHDPLSDLKTNKQHAGLEEHREEQVQTKQLENKDTTDLEEKESKSTVDQHSASATFINPPVLYDPELSQEEAIQSVEECLSRSHPGPHVFIILVRSNSFTEEERMRLISILNCFSDKALHYSILISTDSKGGSLKGMSGAFQKLKEICPMKYQKLKELQKNEKNVCWLFEGMKIMVKNNGGHLTCESAKM
ncbi:GTPase IMAP family member 8-like [Trichomycterus rosablanca]|uniref:GTPase IMAP family member 8-like n=1 Tax=Trichomycterus rosablanca TaxID=2290929 RepID=UPI002F350DEB